MVRVDLFHTCGTYKTNVKSLSMLSSAGGLTIHPCHITRFTTQYVCASTAAVPQYSEWAVGPLSSAKSCPIFMQFTGCQPATSQLSSLFARKCNSLAGIMIMRCNMHGHTNFI